MKTLQSYLFLVGRNKELMIVGDHNVYPGEIETVLLEFQSIADVVVAAKENPKRGEEILAFVVPEPNTEVNVQALMTFCRKQLSPFKVPRKFFVVSQIPRNATGKVLRDQLLAENAG